METIAENEITLHSPTLPELRRWVIAKCQSVGMPNHRAAGLAKKAARQFSGPFPWAFNDIAEWVSENIRKYRAKVNLPGIPRANNAQEDTVDRIDNISAQSSSGVLLPHISRGHPINACIETRSLIHLPSGIPFSEENLTGSYQGELVKIRAPAPVFPEVSTPDEVEQWTTRDCLADYRLAIAALPEVGGFLHLAFFVEDAAGRVVTIVPRSEAAAGCLDHMFPVPARGDRSRNNHFRAVPDSTWDPGLPPLFYFTRNGGTCPTEHGIPLENVGLARRIPTSTGGNSAQEGFHPECLAGLLPLGDSFTWDNGNSPTPPINHECIRTSHSRLRAAFMRRHVPVGRKNQKCHHRPTLEAPIPRHGLLVKNHARRPRAEKNLPPAFPKVGAGRHSRKDPRWHNYQKKQGLARIASSEVSSPGGRTEQHPPIPYGPTREGSIHRSAKRVPAGPAQRGVPPRRKRSCTLISRRFYIRYKQKIRRLRKTRADLEDNLARESGITTLHVALGGRLE